MTGSHPWISVTLEYKRSSKMFKQAQMYLFSRRGQMLGFFKRSSDQVVEFPNETLSFWFALSFASLPAAGVGTGRCAKVDAPLVIKEVPGSTQADSSACGCDQLWEAVEVHHCGREPKEMCVCD